MMGNGNTKLKICGMRDPDNIMEVAALRPDFMGFIFYPGSKRFVGHNFRIPDGFSDEIKRVGVFVNETIKGMLEVVATHALDFVQLHGEETSDTCGKLKESGVGVIKTFSIDETFRFTSVLPYLDKVDYFLFDTKGQSFGGHGRAFDWDILTTYDQSVPYFLSGGLSLDNVGEVNTIKGRSPFALDINSGVEIAPGLKDIDRVRRLMMHIKRGNNEIPSL
jgi:phosphoribosylanthranilate isomerase